MTGPTDDLSFDEKIWYLRDHALVEVDTIWTKDEIIDDFVKDMKDIRTKLTEEQLMRCTWEVCLYLVNILWVLGLIWGTALERMGTGSSFQALARQGPSGENQGNHC